MISPIDYYSPEISLFPQLAQSFADTGKIEPLDFYVILDWKAQRAKTRHYDRLAEKAGSFDVAVKDIAAGLHAEIEPKNQLGLLCDKWGFRLPTASAILTVLYPNVFTIYDIRLCNTLPEFRQLGDMKWSPQVWEQYQRFVAAVRNAAPAELSLRDCDRWLWGQDKMNELLEQLKKRAPKPMG